MDLKDKELVKSLASLIDETLDEIEEIKKSKYAASEIKIEGPGDGIAGKPTNGSLDAKKADDEKEKEEEDEEKKKKKEMDKADCDDMDKAEESEEEESEEEESEEEESEEEESEDEESKEDKKMKKSLEESETLIKSYVDYKFKALEERLSKMAEMIETMADAPVSRKGIPAGVKVLSKSTEDDVQPLTKSDLANSLFELKKSGAHVDSSDIFRVETSKNYGELKAIADKYGVK